MLRVLVYQAPSRTFPMNITPVTSGTIIKPSTALSLNRSPHIDKRAQEHFRFMLAKKPYRIFVSGQSQQKLQRAFSHFRSFFAPLRIRIVVQMTRKFQTIF